MSCKHFPSVALTLACVLFVQIFMAGCSSQQKETPAPAAINTFQFDPNAPTIYQDTFRLSGERFERLTFEWPQLISWKMNMLHIAAMTTDDVETLGLLQAIGYSINDLDDQKGTVLHYAALNPNIEITQYLIDQHADIHAKNSRGETPLVWAAAKNPNAEVVRLLLDAGADIHGGKTKKTRNPTPLLMAAGFNTNPEVVRLLLERGAVVDADASLCHVVFPGIVTPIHMAAGYNPNPEIIKILVDAGADPNAQARNQFRIPLIYAAASNSNPAVLEQLVKAGAEFAPNGSETQKKKAAQVLFVAARRNPHVEVSKWLIGQGVCPFSYDEHHTICEHGMRYNSDLDVTRYYYDLYKAENGEPALEVKQNLLFLARDAKDDAVLESMLLEISGRDTIQDAPLSEFVAFYEIFDPRLLEKLVELGADPHCAKDTAVTMSDVAGVHNYHDLNPFLEKHGIDMEASPCGMVTLYLPQLTGEDAKAFSNLMKKISVQTINKGWQTPTYNCVLTEKSREILRQAALPSENYVPSNMYLIHLAETQRQMRFLDDAVGTTLKIKHTKLMPDETLENIREQGYADDYSAETPSETWQRDSLMQRIVGSLLHTRQSQRALRAANMIYAKPMRDQSIMNVFSSQCYAMAPYNYKNGYEKMLPKALQTLMSMNEADQNAGYLMLTEKAINNHDYHRALVFLNKVKSYENLDQHVFEFASQVYHQRKQTSESREKLFERLIERESDPFLRAIIRQKAAQAKFIGDGESVTEEQKRAFVDELANIWDEIDDLPISFGKLHALSELTWAWNSCDQTETAHKHAVRIFEEIQALPDDHAEKATLCASTFRESYYQNFPRETRLAIFKMDVDAAISRYRNTEAKPLDGLDSLLNAINYSIPKDDISDAAEEYFKQVYAIIDAEQDEKLHKFILSHGSPLRQDALECLLKFETSPEQQFDLLFRNSYQDSKKQDRLIQLAENMTDKFKRYHGYGRLCRKSFNTELADRMMDILQELPDEQVLEIASTNFDPTNNRLRYFNTAKTEQRPYGLQLYEVATEANLRRQDAVEKFNFQQKLITRNLTYFDSSSQSLSQIQLVFDLIEKIPESEYSQRLTAYHKVLDFYVKKFGRNSEDFQQKVKTVLQYVKRIPKETYENDRNLQRMISHIASMYRKNTQTNESSF